MTDEEYAELEAECSENHFHQQLNALLASVPEGLARDIRYLISERVDELKARIK